MSCLVPVVAEHFSRAVGAGQVPDGVVARHVAFDISLGLGAVVAMLVLLRHFR